MIELTLSATEVAIEPGRTAQLEVTITNLQEYEDHVALEIEGIDAEWYALPVPAVTLAPGGSRSAGVIFRVSRSSDVAAGAYPFLVRVKGMETGEVGVHQASLTVKSYSALQMEIEPKRATSSLFCRAPIYDIRITNLGNAPETLDMSCQDPDDHFAYEFETDRIELRPGATVTVGMRTEPRSRPSIGSARLYQFNVMARSANDAYVAATVHGQVEQKAALSTVTASVMLLLAILGIGWWALRPRPVMVRSFTADQEQVVAGSPVTLAWDIENLGDRTYISPGSIAVRTAVGSVVVKPETTTVYTLTARGGGRNAVREITIEVTPKPPPPKARIIAFRADHTRIHPGDVVTLSWQVTGARQLVLNPIGELNPRMDRSRQVMPETTTTYVLSAGGEDQDVVMKSITVDVVPPNTSVAEILGFRADPATIQAGQTARLKWTVTNAASVEIDNGIGAQLKASDGFDVMPATTTVYTLRAADSKGNVVSKQVTVTVNPPDPTSLPPQAPGSVP